MDAVRHVRRAVRADIGESEAAWLREIELHGADGLLPARDRSALDVDLGAVKGGFSDAVDIVDVHFGQNLGQHAFRERPRLGVVHVLVLALGVFRVPARQAHMVVREPQHGVGVGVHLHDALELVLDLLLGAVDMGIVHAHAPHPQ